MSNQADTEIDWREEGLRFNAVADLYESCRPEYPEELIESIITVTRIKPGARILEIGSGTGKATRLFAGRGFSILCVEPGEELVAVARQKLQDYEHVDFEVATFETCIERQNEFDLVISAQAFHWVAKETGYAKAARALKHNGRLALFWNMYPGLHGELAAEIDRVYCEFAPLLDKPEPLAEQRRRREQEIAESGCFGNITVRSFPWSERYTTRQYLGLLNTYSDHLRLPEQERIQLFAGVAEVLEKHGGSIEKPYVAVLYVAEKS